MDTVTFQLKYSRFSLWPDLVGLGFSTLCIWAAINSYRLSPEDTLTLAVRTIFVIGALWFWWYARKLSIEQLQIDDKGIRINKASLGSPQKIDWNTLERVERDAASVEFFCRKGSNPRYFRLELSWFELADWKRIFNAISKYTEDAEQ